MSIYVAYATRQIHATSDPKNLKRKFKFSPNQKSLPKISHLLLNQISLVPLNQISLPKLKLLSYQSPPPYHQHRGLSSSTTTCSSHSVCLFHQHSILYRTHTFRASTTIAVCPLTPPPLAVVHNEKITTLAGRVVACTLFQYDLQESLTEPRKGGGSVT
ncbi:hypothetical protein Patl1_26207 [Pistacia atlantica]|uniref:Uncharacterized protein n=1 Tax=Pistacia atlantica TaxID=434234 RepID=A0ACC1B1W2_9ROSI|nr:hypothetical protein Patl1_26207 [Pistacia atlantica]